MEKKAHLRKSLTIPLFLSVSHYNVSTVRNDRYEKSDDETIKWGYFCFSIARTSPPETRSIFPNYKLSTRNSASFRAKIVNSSSMMFRGFDMSTLRRKASVANQSLAGAFLTTPRFDLSTLYLTFYFFPRFLNPHCRDCKISIVKTSLSLYPIMY